MVANLTSFETLDHREYVAFGGLEPGGFGAADAMAPLGLLSLGMSQSSIATPPDPNWAISLSTSSPARTPGWLWTSWHWASDRGSTPCFSQARTRLRRPARSA